MSTTCFCQQDPADIPDILDGQVIRYKKYEKCFQKNKKCTVQYKVDISQSRCDTYLPGWGQSWGCLKAVRPGPEETPYPAEVELTASAPMHVSRLKVTQHPGQQHFQEIGKTVISCHKLS